MTDYSVYNNPLITRYASKEMQRAFSDEKRFKLWRKLWIALAEAEAELGLPITKAQIEEMKKYQNDVNYDVAEAYEKQVRHDVMAHVKAFGDQAKNAAPIIHLGATSCYVNCNSEAIMIADALQILRKKLVNVIDKLKNFALKYKSLPTLGFTHLQPAQLTTVGKRASLWLQDLCLDLENVEHLISTVRLRGVKGTTGTQASFMELFSGDEEKVKTLEKKVLDKIGALLPFPVTAYPVTGQTYPRKFDYNVLCVLSQISQSAYKFANDMRLLQSMKELEEPFEKNQIGSSAMAYKRNPMRCERMCALARYAISLPVNSAITSSTQWLERTLDDSANRRIVNAQAFLATDAVLNVYMNVAENIVVYEKTIEKHVREELPFMATENILMECVKAGGNRQELHEEIRVMSMQAALRVKGEGKENNLLQLIKANGKFAAVHGRLQEITDPQKFIGRAPSQVEEFIRDYVNPVLQKYADLLGEQGNVSV